MGGDSSISLYIRITYPCSEKILNVCIRRPLSEYEKANRLGESNRMVDPLNRRVRYTLKVFEGAAHS